MDLAQDLIVSPHSRPVDQRIMAYLELFKIVGEFCKLISKPKQIKCKL